MRVDDRGHAVVVDVHGAAEHALAGDDALVLSLVRQHGAVDAVADRVDVRDHRLEPERGGRKGERRDLGTMLQVLAIKYYYNTFLARLQDTAGDRMHCICIRNFNFIFINVSE